MAANVTRPVGCGPGVDSLYHRLCDLSTAWGVVLETFAATGFVFCLVFLVSLLASLPFVGNRDRRSSVALHAPLLVFTAGLFGLTFAFIVGKDFSTCVSRRFLFGVLFGGCFSCLLMQSVRAGVLARHDRGPPAWLLCLGALALWLVEVVINIEWLVITVARRPPPPLDVSRTAAACEVANEDFVMALIYVMVLIVAVVAASAAVLGGRHRRWWREGACILAAAVLSVGIWVAWIVMYVHGNLRHGGPTWDDPTLAIALVANAWTFLLVYTVPEVCCLTAEDQNPQPGENLYVHHGSGYENVLKEQSQSGFMDNKAFSLDEASPGVHPVSPYSGYSGQLRSSVYQPTELALISQSVTNPPDLSHEIIIPRASAVTAVDKRSSTSSSHNKTPVNGHNGDSLQRTSHW